MASTSTVPAAKAKLFELLQARTELAGATISWAAPSESADRRRDAIWLGRVEQTEEWGPSLGAHSRTEDYTITVMVRVQRTGDEPQTVEARCEAIRAEVAATIHDDPGLDGTVNLHAEVAGTDFDTDPGSPSGWVSIAAVRVHVTARLPGS